MIEVVNRQRKVALEIERWEEFAARAVKMISAAGNRADSAAGNRADSAAGDSADSAAANGGVTIAFVSDRSMRELNRRWRRKSGTTDVLSFPAGQDDFEFVGEASLGDVAISVEQAARQALTNRLTLDTEISQLILHGLLHLSGYDHETDNGEMNRIELRLRRRLGIEK